MVSFITQVKFYKNIRSFNKIMKVLQEYGFTIIVRDTEYIAISKNVEAQDIKVTLRKAEVKDKEYYIHLDYIRNWGVL